MAEICLECYNNECLEYNEKNLSEKDVMLENELCEWCEKIKPCIVIIKEKNIIKRFLKGLNNIL